MKVDPPRPPQDPRKATPAKEFQKILADAAKKPPTAGQRPPPTPKLRPVIQPAKPVLVASARLVVGQRAVQAGTEARSHAASQQLGDVLSKAHLQSANVSEDRSQSRLRSGLESAVQKELHRGSDGKPPLEKEPAPRDEVTPRSDGPAQVSLQTNSARPASQIEPSHAAQKVETITALVERIEAAIRDGQPSLKLSLSGTHAASVEVTRAGKGEVSVRIDGRGAKSRAALSEQLSALKEGLLARGLKVKSIEIR